VSLTDKNELMKIIGGQPKQKGARLLITAGAGDIDTLVEPIRRLLTL